MANTPLASLKFPGLPDTYTIPKNDELVNEGVKTALLQLAQKVAYIDEDGQDYYDDLYNALYPAVGVNNIIAVFNSGGVTIYNTNTLDDLRQYLTVTAIMTDSSTEVVTTYTLSGSMDAGAQTVTVAYGGKTTTFTVTVVEWLVSISAVFTQGSAIIYDSDSLDTLKQYLVVTATYADSTTATIASTDYTLSGTLAVGTSAITVSYGGKTDTFSVTVTSAVWYELYDEVFNNDKVVLPGISLFDQGDRDFSIVCDFTSGGQASNQYWYLWSQTLSASPYPGTACMADSSSTGKGLRIGWMNDATDAMPSLQPSWTGDFKIAYSHKAGSGVAKAVYKFGSQTAVSVTRTSAFVTPSGSQFYGPFRIGNGNRLKGTVHEFIVYKTAFTDEQLAAYVG